MEEHGKLTAEEKHRMEYGVAPDYVLGRVYRKLEEIRDIAEGMMEEVLSVNVDAPRTPGEPWPPLSLYEWASKVLGQEVTNRRLEGREREQSAS